MLLRGGRGKAMRLILTRVVHVEMFPLQYLTQIFQESATGGVL